MVLLTKYLMRCRLCGETIGDVPRLVFDRAPSGAQDFGVTPIEAQALTIKLTIVACNVCGLVQSESPAVAYHRNAISAAGVSPAMKSHRLSQALQLAALIEKPYVKLVLVGCGSGYELPILAEAGFDPVGVEWGGAPLGQKGPHPIIDAYPSVTTLSHELFGAFACFNFLEHAPEPREFLNSIRSWLTTDAVGLIEVPNYAKQRRDGRAAAYIADHLSYFDKRTLAAMITVSGFEILNIREVRDGENLEVVLKPMTLVKIEDEQAMLTSAFSRVAEFFARTRAAGLQTLVWGASHEALTILCGISKEYRPAAIIDSAQFKQGLFAPVTGIPIIAPTRNALCGVGLVLIIAPGFESEIKQTLRNQYGFKGEIWTAHAQGVEKLG
jgi:hypothetical protein